MTTLTLLTELATDLPRFASFLPERCLRRRLSRSACRRCVDTCPGAAISVHDNQIRFDGDRCSGCMLCSASCPSDAFEFAGFDLEQELQSLPSRDVTVFCCPRQPQVHPEEHVIPCVGGLSLEHLLHIGIEQTGRVIFNTTACGTCENAAAYHHFTGRLRLLQGCDTVVLNAELMTLADAEVPCSVATETRRSFLAGITNNLAAAVASKLSEDIVESENGQDRSRRIPQKVKLVRALLDNADQEQKELISSLCLHRIQVNEDCTVCPLCKGMCPTGAIKIEKSGSEKALLIDDTRCSGCGLCAAFCTHDALTLHKPVSRIDRVTEKPE